MPGDKVRIKPIAVGSSNLQMLRVGDQIDLRIQLQGADGGAPSASPAANDFGQVWAISHPQGQPLAGFVSETRIPSNDPNTRIARVTLLKTGLIRFQGTLHGIQGDTGPSPILVNASLAPLSLVQLQDTTPGAIRVGLHVSGAPSARPLYVTYSLHGGPLRWADFFLNADHHAGGIWTRNVHWGNAGDDFKRCAIWLYQLLPGAHQAKVRASVFDKQAQVDVGVAELAISGPL